MSQGEVNWENGAIYSQFFAETSRSRILNIYPIDWVQCQQNHRPLFTGIDKDSYYFLVNFNVLRSVYSIFVRIKVIFTSSINIVYAITVKCSLKVMKQLMVNWYYE